MFFINSAKYSNILKIGYTARSLDERMREHYPTKGPNQIKRYKVLFLESSMKNDGYPMLLIGIKIHNAYAGEASKKIKRHQLYCSSLIGQQKDVYLSGHHESQKIDIHIGDQLNLRNIHSLGKHYPYWADFYWVEKRDE